MTGPPDSVTGPHRGQPILHAGDPLEHAQAAMVMLHGRGASARDILTLSEALVEGLPQAPAGESPWAGFAFLAPQAANNTWYLNRFMQPIETNEPWLSSALSFVEFVLAQVQHGGIPLERTLLLGFSQGACLALEYAARHARRYGGLVGLSGGLIGPDGTPRDYAGSLAGTPVFLGCSDVDVHVPKERVAETAQVLERLSAHVTMRLYPNMGHEVNQDELEFIREMMASVRPRIRS